MTKESESFLRSQQKWETFKVREKKIDDALQNIVANERKLKKSELKSPEHYQHPWPFSVKKVLAKIYFQSCVIPTFLNDIDVFFAEKSNSC